MWKIQTCSTGRVPMYPTPVDHCENVLDRKNAASPDTEFQYPSFTASELLHTYEATPLHG